MIDELTAREREVLSLVEGGLTNEQIAERLGITSDGVKYHVSQAMSKLDVGSRYEAAAMARRRRPAWLSVPVALRILAGTAATGVVVVLAILVVGVLRSGGGDEMTVSQVLDGVRQAASRDGQILHSQARYEDGPTGTFTYDYWIDPETNAIRSVYTPIDVPYRDGTATLDIRLYKDGYEYLVEGQRFEAPYCPDLGPTWMSHYLSCQPFGRNADVFPEISVESGEWEGRPAVLLVLSTEVELPTLPPEAGLPSSASNVAVWSSRLFLDSESFLPLASRTAYDYNGLPNSLVTEATYINTFLPRSEELLRTLDPVALGYEPELTQLASLDAEVPLYWLGETWAADDPENSVEISHIQTSQLNGPSVRLSYAGSDSLIPAIVIEHWLPEAWADAAQGPVRQLLDDPDCVTQSTRDFGGRAFVLYEAEPVRYPLASRETSTQAGCWWRAIDSGTALASNGYVLVWEGADVVLLITATTMLSDLDEVSGMIADLRKY
jgi:DNA-binding CsgD family transcriptional regulator